MSKSSTAETHQQQAHLKLDIRRCTQVMKFRNLSRLSSSFFELFNCMDSSIENDGATVDSIRFQAHIFRSHVCYV